MEQPGVSVHELERRDRGQEHGAVGAVHDGKAAGPQRGGGPLVERGQHRQQRVLVQVADAVAAERDRLGRLDVGVRLGASEHPREPVLTEHRSRGRLTDRTTHAVEAHADELWIHEPPHPQTRRYRPRADSATRRSIS